MGHELTRQDWAEEEDQSEDRGELSAAFFLWAAGEGGHAKGMDLGGISLSVGDFRRVYLA